MPVFQLERLLVCEEWRYNLITSLKKKNNIKEEIVALNKKDKRKAKDMQRDVCGWAASDYNINCTYEHKKKRR